MATTKTEKESSSFRPTGLNGVHYSSYAGHELIGFGEVKNDRVVLSAGKRKIQALVDAMDEHGSEKIHEFLSDWCKQK